MRRTITILFAYTFCHLLYSQEERSPKVSFLDINYFYGNIARHNDDILHLITGHPEGLILGWSRKTFGQKEWEQRYNYPDFGLSFTYQNLKNEFLGENFGLYGHYTFYFLKRSLMLRIGQGLALTTNPYDKEDNFRNIAFGSRLMSSTLLQLNYKREKIIGRFGMQAGLSLIHYSNANVKAPNTSINSITLNVGVNYLLQDDDEIEYRSTLTDRKYSEPIRYNLLFRTGVNEGDIVGSGQFPFYIFTGYIDKRLSYTSALQFGAEIFFSNFLKEYIRYNSVAFPELGVTGDEDHKRVGVFIGHELFINKLSIPAQIGYYVYYPVEFELRTYLRIGLQYYFTPKLFAGVAVKAHAARAEAAEFSIGVRL